MCMRTSPYHVDHSLEMGYPRGANLASPISLPIYPTVPVEPERSEGRVRVIDWVLMTSAYPFITLHWRYAKIGMEVRWYTPSLSNTPIPVGHGWTARAEATYPVT
uniref:Uncharacterized protein n=1 Tax=Candida gigantensis TaxID=271359 RepID=S5TGN5_9ASCO|nr:hypothetical protein [Candida gigantensis]YP_008475268.1 hypothetical protein [Candida gigantensis]AGS44582.1 hypothetical protein [Candida gigantensis]AGS44583.1 hypothetical protein [Candida gigantensis]